MQLVPALPSWLFEDEDNKGRRDDEGNLFVSFKLFGEILVTYHNPDGRNLYGVSPTSYVVRMKSGEEVNVDGPTIPTETAIAIRRVSAVQSIDAFF
jgi:hypothetical protein